MIGPSKTKRVVSSPGPRPHICGPASGKALFGLAVLAAAHGFEWAGLFELTAGNYSWTAAKVDDAYADATMKIAFVPTTGHDADAIEAVKHSDAVKVRVRYTR